ncbi:hypothetical protein ACFYXH_13520 [Streptomyces sp. NPDC002730]|uniref:hypothetical protein n=1 Tax=Streptomyces sp. NPDC002730 TaxID=3364662 RepID=UPI0036B18EAA
MTNSWGQWRARHVAVCLRESEVRADGGVVPGRVGEAGSGVEGTVPDRPPLAMLRSDG